MQVQIKLSELELSLADRMGLSAGQYVDKALMEFYGANNMREKRDEHLKELIDAPKGEMQEEEH